LLPGQAAVHSSFDPLRVLATELASGFLDDGDVSDEPAGPAESAGANATPRPHGLAVSVTTRWFIARFEVARVEPE
jgi:hypothetical protein